MIINDSCDTQCTKFGVPKFVFIVKYKASCNKRTFCIYIADCENVHTVFFVFGKFKITMHVLGLYTTVAAF